MARTDSPAAGATPPATTPGATGEPPSAATGRVIDHPVAGWAVLGLGLAALLGYALWMGRGTFFFSDDWDIIAFHHDGNELVPFNSHLSLVPISVFRALFVTVGISTYWPYRLVGLVVYGLLGVTVFVFARSRVPPVLAAIAALGLLAFSAADINLMFPFLINFSIPIAATVGVGMLLDRGSRRADVGAGGLIALALGCSGIGLMAVVAATVELAWRRAPLRRWALVAVPFAAWLSWYAWLLTSPYDEGVAPIPGIWPTVQYAIDEVVATFSAFTLGNRVGGVILALAMAALFVVAAKRWKTFDGRTAGALAAFGAFTALTAVTRIGIVPEIPPETGRYLWVNAAFLIIAAVQVCRGRHIAWGWVATVAVIVALGAGSLVGNLRTYRDGQLSYRANINTYLLATEATDERADPERILPLSFIVVTVEDYRDAADHLGSAMDGVGLADLGSEDDRRRADDWMIDDLGISVDVGGSLPPGDCGPVVGSGNDGTAAVEVAPGSSVLVSAGDAPGVVRLARFAERFGPFPDGEVAAGEQAVVTIPADHSEIPWRVQLESSGGSLRTCPSPDQ